MNKNELREARLKAFDANTGTRIVASTSPDLFTSNSYSLSQIDFEQLNNLIYKKGGATEDDMLRWYHQGFQFCNVPNFGLIQGNGGPCGILAVVQAEILTEIMFEHGEKYSNDLELPLVPDNNREDILTVAMQNILIRAAHTDKTIHLCSLQSDELKNEHLIIHRLKATNSSESLLLKAHINQFYSRLGCILFLYSLILTRGMKNIMTEMDDANNTLIGQYGHCNQDLINLLLTGKATSNVFDGEMVLGESGLMIRGIEKKCKIGYITHLEALRYCQVGTYLKIPEYPIWVVGSSSHFTVLFSVNKKINEESLSDKLRSLLQRCFKAVDNDECGFIPAAGLKQTLEMVVAANEFVGVNNLIDIINTPAELARLRGYIQTDGEIIIWSSFWESISRLMSGENLDDIIALPPEFMITDTSQGAIHPSNLHNSSDPHFVMDLDGNIIDNDMGQTSVGNATDKMIIDSNEERLRSDSDLARELQSQLDNESLLEFSDMPSGSFGQINANNRPTDRFTSGLSSIQDPSNLHHQTDLLYAALGNDNYSNANETKEIESRMRSDSEIAREMQEQWNLEEDNNVMNFNSDVFPNNPAEVKDNMSVMGNSSVSANTFQTFDSPVSYHRMDHIDQNFNPLSVFETTDKKRDAAQSLINDPVKANKRALFVHRSDSIAEEDAEEYTIYHFNGLESLGRSAKLTKFILYQRSALDAVGIPVAFEGAEASAVGGSFICPIEEVLRTRWPGCRINWLGDSPPSID